MASTSDLILDLLSTAEQWEEKLRLANSISTEVGNYWLSGIGNQLDEETAVRAAPAIEQMEESIAAVRGVMAELSDHHILGPLFRVGPDKLSEAAREMFSLSQGGHFDVTDRHHERIDLTELRGVLAVTGSASVPMQPDSASEFEDGRTYTWTWWAVPEEHRKAAREAAVKVAAVRELLSGSQAQEQLVTLAEDYAARLNGAFQLVEEANSRVADVISNRGSVTDRVSEMLSEL